MVGLYDGGLEGDPDGLSVGLDEGDDVGDSVGFGDCVGCSVPHNVDPDVSELTSHAVC